MPGGTTLAQKGNPASQRQRSAPPGAGSNAPLQIDRDDLYQKSLLLSLLDNIPGMVYRGMPDWSLSFIGSEVERITGFAPAEILGKPNAWRELIHPDDFRSVQETILFCVRRREPILRMEYRIVRKDGENRWINDRRRMIYDDAGQLLCIDGLCLDITDQKTAEMELRAAFERAEAARARTEAIIAGMGDGISIHSPDHAILYENRVLRELIGGREGATCHQFHDCLSRGRDECPVAKSFADGGIHNVERVAVTDRGGVPIEVTTSPIRGAGGDVTSVVSIVRDISRRKRDEEERHRLAAAVEYAADAILVTDAEWIVQYVNPAFEKITGYAKKDVLGRNPYILAADGENIRVILGIEDKIRSGSPWKGRLKNKRKDGVLIVQDTVVYPIRGPGGKIVNHVVTSRDITREIQLEKQAQTAQQMEAVGTLAGGIAHDFNNALTGITGFAGLLRMRLEKEPKLQRDVDEILKCAERASMLTKQLLAFARRQIIEPVVLDLNTVVRDLSRLMKKVSGEHVEMRTRLTEGISPVFADRGQLEQVLLNLCLNSRDAMPGGGEFLVSTDVAVWEEEREEDNAVMPAGQYILLAVADDGTGMDDATRKRVFEPYFTTKAPGKGTGLGLSMVYGIVKQNGGFVFLDTRPGEGTTFRIYFPASQAVSEEKGEKKEAAVKGGTETILVAEDEEAIRNLAERSLRGYGYEVLAARDGVEAVAIFEAHPEIAIAVLDVVMPRMGGKEALDAFRLVRPDLKALYTSGYSTDRIHESFVLLPGIDFLPKPYGPASLARRVREVLDKV
jgi:two-component system NtrC family sensor kinase